MKKKEVLGGREKLQDNSFDINNTFPLEVYKPVWETRARLRSKFNNLLMDTSIGQLLIQAGFLTHPILKEKDRQIDHFLWLANSYSELDLISENNLLTQLYNEPDIRLQNPHSTENIIKLESLIEHYFKFKSIYHSYKHNEFKDIKIIDRLKFNEESEDCLVIINEIKTDIQDLLYCNLRNYIFLLIKNENWKDLISFLCNSHLDVDLQEPLIIFLNKISPKFFKHKKFREELYYFMIQNIAINELSTFDRFNEYLVGLNFPIFTDKEKKNFFTYKFFNKLLIEMHNNHSNTYFESIKYFLENNILEKDVFQNSVIFQIHILENALRAFNGYADLVKFQNFIKPLILEIGLFSDNELSSANKLNLYQKYWDLCLRHSYSVHTQIKYS